MDGEQEEKSSNCVYHVVTVGDDTKALTPTGSKVAENARKLNIEFSKLNYTVPRRKGKARTILQNVSGSFQASKLTTIVGPSGAGKTSLLSIMSGHKVKNVKGSIYVNGEERQMGEFRKDSCYIPQEFSLLPLLTVKESLLVAGRLKLGKACSSHTRNLRVTEVVERLGLTECLDTMTEKLSGGEKKRLSIGVELITNPPVIFLDEPTSGLDSAASIQVIGLLHSIAQTGCTVVCAVHQPSSKMIAYFDDLLILSQGKCFYCGPCDEILATFQDAGYDCPPFYNIAEFVLEVVTGQRGGDLNHLHKKNFEKYSDSLQTKKEAIKPFEYSQGESQPTRPAVTPNYQISNFEQQRILLSRAVICIKRDNTLTKLRFAAHIAVAFLLSAVFYNFGEEASKVQSNISCIFFCLLFIFFGNAMPAVQMFPVEAAVFVREHLNNWYSLWSYYITKVIADLPLQFLCPSVFLIIAYYLTGQPMETDRFLKVWMIFILLTILAQSVGIVTGAMFNTQLGVFLVPALSIPMFLFAGFFVKFDEVPSYLRPLCTISFCRYAFEGILQAVYGYDRPALTCSTGLCYFHKPAMILRELDMPSVDFYTTILALVCWILSIHLSIYGVLLWKVRIHAKL